MTTGGLGIVVSGQRVLGLLNGGFVCDVLPGLDNTSRPASAASTTANASCCWQDIAAKLATAGSDAASLA